MHDLIDAVLSLARGSADWAEVYFVSEEETPVSFEANRLRSIETRATQGMALRVVARGRIGFASTSRLDEPEALVQYALATAEFGAHSALSFPEAKPIDAQLDLYDQTVATLSPEAMVQMGQAMIDQVHVRGEDLLCDADVRKSTATITIANSSGVSTTFQQTVLSAGLHANRIRGTDMLDIWEEEAVCHRSDLDVQRVAGAVLAKLDLADPLVSVRTGTLPVIFTPKGVAMTLLAPLQAALNGKMVLQGASPLGGRRGEKVFDGRFSLFDDGRVPRRPGSAPVDGEGVPTRRLPLVQGGWVTGFYYDLQTAGLAGTESTGNGQRGLGSLPSLGIHALRIAPGDVSIEAMLADIREGLLVDQTMGAWAGNVLGGEFSGNAHLAFKIESGRLVGRVKDTMVSGNVFRAFEELAGVGSRAEWVGGNIEVPHLYFPALSVAGR